MIFLDEGSNQELAKQENNLWRKDAEYDRYTLPLRLRLKSVDWTKLMVLHRARWQREGAVRLQNAKDKNGQYRWFGWYRNRRIQRYPLRPRWGFIKTLALPIPTPVAYAERLFEENRALWAEVYAQQIARERSAAPSERQYLAKRLRGISLVLSDSGKQFHAAWQPVCLLSYFIEVGKPAAFQGYTDAAQLGEMQAKLDYFALCLREFHEAEKQVPAAIPLANAAGLFNSELPATVRKRLDYFSQLLTRLANAPLWDTHETLDAALAEYKAEETDLLQGRKFIARLGHYLTATPIDATRRERIESWAFWAKEKEQKFLDDLMQPEWKEVVTEADRATLEGRLHVFTTTGRRTVIGEEDSNNFEKDILQIEKRLAELNAARPLDTPAEPSQPGSPAPDKGCPQDGDTLDTAPAPPQRVYQNGTTLDTAAPTVADLCRAPFTPPDLNRLLTDLDVLTETLTPAGPIYCLSGSLNKKGAVRISKTFAALTELNTNGFLNWTGWQAAMKAPPYGLTFGEKVRAYEYKSKNTRRQSDTFDTAIEQTRRWLNRWRAAYNSQKQP